MTLEVVRGESRNRQAASLLAEELRGVVSEGTIYLGYPVLATADEKVEVDALLVSRERGLIAFLLADAVASNSYRLRFRIPTAAEITDLRHIHRDRPEGEEETVRKATEGVEMFLEAVERGEMDFFDLPPALRTRLTRLGTNTAKYDDS